MFRRQASPAAIVHALALTLAVLLAGAWDSGGHGHDRAAANAAAVDHESEAAGDAGRAAVSQAAALNDHSCVACNQGRSKTVEERNASIAGHLDPSSAATGSENGGRPTSGERWRQTARGPPLG